MIHLHKVLPALVSPIAIIIYLLILSLFVKARWPRILALAALLIASNPIIANYAILYLEKDYPPVVLGDIPSVDAIVILSGMTHSFKQENGEIAYEFNGAVDRFEAGIELMQSGKSDILVFTRGALPWSVGIPEGEYLRTRAIDRGIDEKQIKLTENVQNTAQEARAIARMFPGGQKIALVTSAFHMPRSLRVFEQQGLDIVTVPVDHIGKNHINISPIHFFPEGISIANVSLFFRELLGRAYYALRA